MRVTVANDGSQPVTGIAPTATVTPADVATPGAATPATFTLAAGAERTVEIPLETLVEGEASVRVRTPGTVSGRATTATAALALDVSGASYDVDWSTDPVRPEPGDPFVLVAHVVNATGGPLRDVTPTLALDPGDRSEQSAPTPARLTTLAAGAGADLRWTVRGETDLDAVLELSGTDADDAQVTGRAEHRIRLRHQITVTETGDEEIDPDALAADECDIDDDPSTLDCTMRAAIQLANSREDAAIGFDLDAPGGPGGPSVPVIAPRSPLPTVTTGAEIDGTTQSGGWVRLDGSQVRSDAGSASGLVLDGRPTVVRGLVIGWWRAAADAPDRSAGIRVVAGEGHRLLGNRIGTDADGTDIAPNDVGVLVERGSVVLGGTEGTTPGACTGDCNLVAGNPVQVLTRTPGSVVQGNFIGLDLTGARVLGADGLAVASGTTVGGPTARAGSAPGNVVAAPYAITVRGRGTEQVTIQGNLLGLDPTGRRALQVDGSVAPSPYGIAVQGDDERRAQRLTLVGGPTPQHGNVISGYVGDGTGPGPQHEGRFTGRAGVTAYYNAHVLVQHNRIGTDIDGTEAIPNGAGVVGTIFGSTTIDGAWAASSQLDVRDNLISGNDGCGVDYADSVTGNRVGTDASGTVALPNGCGVAHSLDVGGVRPAGSTTCTSPCNLVSGNVRAGIDNGFTGVVRGNFVGTDLDGLDAIPNGTGVLQAETATLGAVSGGQVGGPSGAVEGVCDRACNLVAGNAVPGVAGHVVQGNVVGLDAAGRPLPNPTGVRISYGYRVPGATRTTIGGPGDLGNRISGNAGAAVEVHDNRQFSDGGLPPYTRLTVRGNVVTGNGDGVGDWRAIPLSGGALPSVVAPTATRVGADVHLAGVVAKGGDSTDTVQVALDVTSSSRCEVRQHGERPRRGLSVEVGRTGRTGFTHDLTLGADQRYLTVVATSRGFSSRPFCIPVEEASATTAATERTERGARVMQVASHDDFAPGDTVVIEPGTPREETARVRAIGSLVFAAPLRLAHPAGAAVWSVAAPGGDRQPPRVRVVRPRAGASYERGERVRMLVRCRDRGTGVVRCEHRRTLGTRRLGMHRTWVRAVDANGNARVVWVSYRVVRRS